MPGSSEYHVPPSQRAQAYFEKGNEAALKNNFEYAVKMYRDALAIAPENPLYRQALRGVHRRKFENEPSKVGRLVGARMQPIRMRARSARSKGKFAEALEHCEDAFAHNPWDVQTTQIAAEAAEGLNQPALARWIMESVAPQAGEDAGFFRQLAHVYEINSEYERAILCWEKVRKLDPNDEEASRQIKGLSASETIARSGLNNALQRSEQQAEAEQTFSESVSAGLNDLKRHAQTPEERLRHEIEQDPTRVGPYLELTEMLKRGEPTRRGRKTAVERSQGLAQ